MAYTSARDVMFSIVESSGLLVEVKGEYKDKLMKTLLEMMQDVHEVCVKHGIVYSLAGGSALGAVRHKGFIPWDDDLDINMLRSDFEKFKDIFEYELGDKYILNAPNYGEIESKYTFGKIYKKGTELWEVQETADNFPFPRCINLDVFIYDYVSTNKIIRKFDGLISNLMKGIGTSMLYLKYDSPILESYYGVTPQSRKYFKKRRLLGVIHYVIPHKTWVNIFDKFVSRHKKSPLITCPTGRKYYNGEIIPFEWWNPVSKIDFEGHMFYVINNVHKYLVNLYGENYMQLPPENKRERHFCVKLNFGDGVVLEEK